MKPLIKFLKNKWKKLSNDIAIVDHDRKISYQELNHDAESMASLILKEKIQPQEFIAIGLDRGYELIAGLLAILKVRGIYVPIDLEYPDARIVLMIREANIKLLLTHKKYKKDRRTLFADLLALG